MDTLVHDRVTLLEWYWRLFARFRDTNVLNIQTISIDAALEYTNVLFLTLR
jgi:hypothetical protein